MKLTLDMIAKDVAEKALDEFIYEGKTIREWVEILAKQQPCDDCVSRQEFEKRIKPYDTDDKMDKALYNFAHNILISCTSVQPQSLEQIKWERDTAIEQLKQLGYGLGEKVEPCEDCVSREALKERFRWLEKATKYGNEDAEQQHFSYSTMMMYEIKDEIDDAIDSLPSVKPQRPQGKWIEQNDTSKHHFGWYYCSNCGAYLMSADGANYCSCCGAEMEDSND